jgi:hypothetical protein
MFRFWLFLARRGFFTHGGMRGYQPAWWPCACVRYDPNEIIGNYHYSSNMAIGNAVEYARLFGGTVVPVRKRRTVGGS